jgi:hypothetical protein
MKYFLYPLIPLVAPIAYLFRNKVKHGFLWWFLSSGNMYGDTTWRPKLKSKFFRAYLWMHRNPLQNLYWKDYVAGIETDFSGTLRFKYRADPLMWRTMICSDTGDWHGKILDFERSLFGVQNITFKRTNADGTVQNCYRKSTCIPHRVLWWIVLVKRRAGHEAGLIQHNFTFPVFKYAYCKPGWQAWRKKQWVKMEIK